MVSLQSSSKSPQPIERNEQNISLFIDTSMITIQNVTYIADRLACNQRFGWNLFHRLPRVWSHIELGMHRRRWQRNMLRHRCHPNLCLPRWTLHQYHHHLYDSLCTSHLWMPTSMWNQTISRPWNGLHPKSFGREHMYLLIIAGHNLHCWQVSLQSTFWMKFIPQAAEGMIPQRIGYASAQSGKGQDPTQLSPEPLSSSMDAALARPAMITSAEVSRIMFKISILELS